MDGLLIFEEILGILGSLFRFLGFLLVGYGVAQFVLSSYQKASWQVQIALALGFFGLLIAITVFASPGSTGAFALGSGVAFFMVQRTKTEDKDAEEKKSKKK